MKQVRSWSVVAAMIVVGSLMQVAASSPAEAAGPSGPTTTTDLTSFDGTHTGPDPVTAGGDRPVYYRFDAADGVSRDDLGPSGSATFTTTVRADPAAATWTTDGELEAAGLARVVAGETFVSNGTTFNGANPLGSPSHDGDPLVFAQYNGGGPGNPTCANGKFFVAGSWVFGDGAVCQIANDSADQSTPIDGGAQRYTITIHGDGAWTASITPLDADGDVVTSFTTPGAQTFSGTLPGSSSTKFAPVLRLRPGSATGADWHYTISDSTFSTTVVPVHVVTGGDVSSDGSSGWALETLNGGTGSFVQGVGTPPMGTGSYHLKSNATGDKDFLHLTKIAGVPLLGRPLTDITELSFRSYASDGTYSPYVNIPIHSAAIDTNKDGIADGDQPGVPGASGNAVLVYEPAVAGGAWGTSDTISDTAKWRLTRPVVVGGVTTPLWTYQTFSDWTTQLGDAIVNPVYGDIQWIIGDTSSASWGGREGWVDEITVVTTTEAATYDLEEGLGSCPVTIDNATKTLTLKADCTTNQPLTMHDGWTLDGAGYTITAIDPSSGSFTGPILTNQTGGGDARIDVTDVNLVGSFAAGCSGSLQGIQFNDAAGSFTHSTVANVRYGSGSGCQSGNSVDITNLGGANRLQVNVDDVQVTGFQKTGIRANGNVSLRLTNSSVASSDLDLITASNSLQISRGARAYVNGNTIEGNDWDGNTDWNATGVLLYGAEDVTFTRNVVNGTDTDFALYVADAPGYNPGRTTLTCNLFSRSAAADSTPTPGSALDVWDTGVAADEDLTAKIDATGNTVRGFTTKWLHVADDDGGPCTSGPVHALALGGGGTTLTATWSAPTALPYAPVTSYEVTLVPGGDTQTVSGTSADFAVAPGKDYTVTVVPHNAAGAGTARSASIDTSAPAAPSALTAVGSTTSAAVVWTSPSSPTPVTSYAITATPPIGPVVTKTVSASGLTFPVVVSGLAKNTGYTFAVHASNGWGTGPTVSTTLRGVAVVTIGVKRSVAYGSLTTINGKVTDSVTGNPLYGTTVTLRVRPAGSSTYTTVPDVAVKSGRSGLFTLTYRAKVRTNVYVVAEGTTARMAAASRWLPLVVHATSSLSLDRTHAAPGTTVAFAGTARPGKGTVVQLQRRIGTKWVTLRTVHVPAANGRWTTTWKAGSTQASLRIRVSAHGIASGYSTIRVVKVG